MKFLKFLILTIVFVNFSNANPVLMHFERDNTLKAFDIENNVSNRAVASSIQSQITKSDRSLFKSIIETNPDHAYLIKSELEKISAPDFLLYLAMVESKLSNKATSGAKAGGMWQFMAPTAKKYGLRVDGSVDERRDPIASTDAAFAYLLDLKKQFGKWYLALMAYNSGEGRLAKAINATGTNDFETLLKSPAVPVETKKFIKRIIKYAFIAKSENARKVLDLKRNSFYLKKISVSSGISMASIASDLGISESKLKDYNVHIKADITGENSFIYIPQNKYEKFMANADGKNFKAVDLDKADLNIKKYTVKSGDTLIGISKKFDVKIKDIVSLNNIKNSRITVGDDIVLP